mgnify:CR=1 FL=1|jgi:hypothetical protein
MFTQDDKYDWILHKQVLIEKREAAEVELKKQDQLRKAQLGKLDSKKV